MTDKDIFINNNPKDFINKKVFSETHEQIGEVVDCYKKNGNMEMEFVLSIKKQNIINDKNFNEFSIGCSYNKEKNKLKTTGISILPKERGI